MKSTQINLTHDGIINSEDFTCFLNAYGAGCD
jgi:hypothetical protein